MRRRKRANLSRGMLFTWGMGIGLAFLLAIPQEVGTRMQLTYARVFRWPLSFGRAATLAARSTTLPNDVTPEAYKDLLATQTELQNRIANLRADLQETQRRNEKLAGLRQRSGWEKIEVRQARIISPAGQAQSNLFIDCGTEDGVANGQFVVSLSDTGSVDESVTIVGVVAQVAAKTAKIRPITDKDSRVYASVAHLTALGTMEGQGNGTAKVTMIQRTEDAINVGDPVYAQKQPGLDVPVIAARVTQCRPDRVNPLMWDITVEPVCDVATAKDVAVIVSAALPQ